MLFPRPLSAGLAPSCPGNAASASNPIATALGPAASRRLHAVHPAAPGQEAAAAAFALALTLSFETKPGSETKLGRPLLWVQAEAARVESGSPYGPGLAAIGLDPVRVVVLRAKTALAALAAAEMGLEETGLAGVVVDLPARLPPDMLKLGKRLSLRAEQARTSCCLIHATAAAVEMPVASRWTVSSRRLPRTATPDFTSAFEVRLSKNRFGPLGRWSLAWRPTALATPAIPASDPAFETRHATQPFFSRFAFALLPSLPEPVAAPSVDRPAGAPRGAQPTPLRGATA